jgi:hypothetical protein
MWGLMIELFEDLFEWLIINCAKRQAAVTVCNQLTQANS